jgi:hypothetical protein
MRGMGQVKSLYRQLSSLSRNIQLTFPITSCMW